LFVAATVTSAHDCSKDLLVIFYVLDPLLAPILANPVAAEGQEVDPNEVLELEKQRMIR
ncbi:hypothetical protein Tco_1150503, partial [Tanacetum coccineum]